MLNKQVQHYSSLYVIKATPYAEFKNSVTLKF